MKRGKFFLTSKTFWALVFTALVTFYDALKMAFPELPDIPPDVIKVLQALGLLGALYGRKVADAPLTAKPGSKRFPTP